MAFIPGGGGGSYIPPGSPVAPTTYSDRPGYGLIHITDGIRELYVPATWLPARSNKSFNTYVGRLLTKYVRPLDTDLNGGSGPTRTAPTGKAGAGGGGGGNSPKKQNDKPQVDALKKMLESEQAQRDIKLGNISLNYKQTDSDILLGYEERVDQLELSIEDNEKAENDTSFANLVNLARERADILVETATQGAGESDTQQAQLMALRNWDSNQDNVNRSYFDTLRSANSAIVELNADARSARIGSAQAMKSDRGKVWNDYFNQRTDTYTQLGNISANPYSDSFEKNAKYYDKAAKTTAKSYEDTGTPAAIRNWEGTATAVEDTLNNTDASHRVTNLAEKKPSGAGLRTW